MVIAIVDGVLQQPLAVAVVLAHQTVVNLKVAVSYGGETGLEVIELLGAVAYLPDGRHIASVFVAQPKRLVQLVVGTAVHAQGGDVFGAAVIVGRPALTGTAFKVPPGNVVGLIKVGCHRFVAIHGQCFERICFHPVPIGEKDQRIALGRQGNLGALLVAFEAAVFAGGTYLDGAIFAGSLSLEVEGVNGNRVEYCFYYCVGLQIKTVRVVGREFFPLSVDPAVEAKAKVVGGCETYF